MGNNWFRSFLSHPLFVALMSGLFGAIFGVLFTGWKLKNDPPVAKIVPSNASVNAAESIMFDANGSTDSENGNLKFQWKVNGRPWENAIVASCDKNNNGSMINCRFASPGIHSVSVTVTDKQDSSRTALASVNVKLLGGYVAFVIRSDTNESDPALIQAFNYAVDWPKVQALMRGKPIVLFDPDRKEPVFALDIKQSISKAKENLNQSTHGNTLKIIGQLIPAAMNQIRRDLSKIGMLPAFIQLPMGEVYLPLERELGRSGIVILSDINELKTYYE